VDEFVKIYNYDMYTYNIRAHKSMKPRLAEVIAGDFCASLLIMDIIIREKNQ
jgi:hypothetical protein